MKPMGGNSDTCCFQVHGKMSMSPFHGVGVNCGWLKVACNNPLSPRAGGFTLKRLMQISLKIPFWPPRNSGWKWHIPTIADSNSLALSHPKKKIFFIVVDSRAYMSLAKKLCFSHRLQTHQAIRCVLPWHVFSTLHSLKLAAVRTWTARPLNAPQKVKRSELPTIPFPVQTCC